MKNQLSRLLALSALSLGLFATGNGWAYFSGSLSKIPNPESAGGWLGDASVSNYQSGSGYANGWTYARFDSPTDTDTQISWCSKGWAIGEGDWDGCVDSGAGSFAYKVTENNWDGTVYEKGQSQINTAPPGSGYASGDIW